MNLLENAHVFCINTNGVAEGCHFLTLVSCRTSLESPESQYVKKRFRTNSLPSSLEVFYDSGESTCERKVFDLISPRQIPTRSLSESLLRPCQEETLNDPCFKWITNIAARTEEDAKKKKRRQSRRPGVPCTNGTRKSRSRPDSGIMRRPKMQTYTISHHKPQIDGGGIHCAATSLQMDGYMLSYFISEMKRSHTFRSSFIRRWCDQTTKTGFTVSAQKKTPNILVLVALMRDPEHEVLDLLGNKMVNSNILFRRSLEHALSWLSTLGGAFSALGDLSPTYAEEAGHVSITQLRIAMKLDDPGIKSRCRLYAAISLLQRGFLKSCRDIVKQEYKNAMLLSSCSDPRLRRMCLGIWAKLQYHWKLAAATDKKRLKSTEEGLKDIRSNAKYWNVYDLEENRRIMSYDDVGNS